MVLCAPLSVSSRATVAGGRVDDVPVWPFERRHVEQACRRARSPCGRSRPRESLSQSVFSVTRSKAREALEGGEVEPAVAALAAMPLTFSGCSPLDGPGGDALDELVAVVDVEDEEPDTAELEVVADAGHGHVEEAALRASGVLRPLGTRRGRCREQDQERGGCVSPGRMCPT